MNRSESIRGNQIPLIPVGGRPSFSFQVQPMQHGKLKQVNPSTLGPNNINPDMEEPISVATTMVTLTNQQSPQPNSGLTTIQPNSIASNSTSNIQTGGTTTTNNSSTSLINVHALNPCNTNPASPLQNIYNHCVSGCVSLEGCVDTFVGMGPEDVNTLIGQIATQSGTDVNGVCASINNEVSYASAGSTGTKLTQLNNWYRNTFAPAVASTCSSTSNPVNVTALQNLPTNVLQSQFSKTQLFFLQYGLVLSLILFAIIIFLLLVVIGYAHKRH